MYGAIEAQAQIRGITNETAAELFGNWRLRVSVSLDVEVKASSDSTSFCKHVAQSRINFEVSVRDGTLVATFGVHFIQTEHVLTLSGFVKDVRDLGLVLRAAKACSVQVRVEAYVRLVAPSTSVKNATAKHNNIPAFKRDIVIFRCIGDQVVLPVRVENIVGLKRDNHGSWKGGVVHEVELRRGGRVVTVDGLWLAARK